MSALNERVEDVQTCNIIENVEMVE